MIQFPPPPEPTRAEYRHYCTCGHSGYSHGPQGCSCCTCGGWRLDSTHAPDPPAGHRLSGHET